MLSLLWEQGGNGRPRSFKREGARLAGYTVISQIQVIEAEAYPPGIWPKRWS